MSRTLFIVRTHCADIASLSAFDRLAAVSQFDVVFCVDERKKPADMGGRPKVAYTAERLKELGLYAHPNAGWRCGDYCYYVTRVDRPDYDYYWLMEPDVLVNATDLACFFSQFANTDADLLAARLGPRDEKWLWTQTVTPIGLAPFGCLFPITRMSGQAIDCLYQARRRHSADPKVATRDAWPNDEAITASVLHAAGLDCRDLNHADIICHTSSSLGVIAVIDHALVAAVEPDGLIYHPVRDFLPWLRRAEVQIGKMDRLVGKKAAKVSRAEATFLSGVAQACLRYPGLHGAALGPLMIATELWSMRSWSKSSPVDSTQGDTHMQAVCAARLLQRFGTTDTRPRIGVAQLAFCPRNTDRLNTANPDDFEYGPDYALGRFPVKGALPFAYDMQKLELLFTMHVMVTPVLESPFLYASQREHARVIARLPLPSLRHIYGGRNKTLRPVFIFSLGRTGSTLLEQLVGSATQRSISEPDAPTQLAEHRELLRSLPADDRDDLVYYTVAPFFKLQIPGGEGDRTVVKFRSQVNGIAEDFARVFPSAKFVFMLRDHRAWARSTFRAFRLTPAQVAGRLAQGLSALQALDSSGVDLSVIDYDDVVADPATAVARILGQDLSDNLTVQQRIASVMARDSQAAHRLSRETTSREIEGEADWMSAFEQASAGPVAALKRLRSAYGTVSVPAEV